MPCGYHFRICKCCDHPGHERGIPGCKHSGQPGYHLLVTLPGSTGHVATEDRVMLDRTLFSSWPIARIHKQYSKAYPHCEVEVTRLP